MIITKTFTSSFQYIMLAKLRRFVRISIFRYLIAAIMISYSRYLLGSINSDLLGSVSLSSADIVIEGIVGFILLSFSVILLMLIAAKVQSHRNREITVTFKEGELIVTQEGESTHHDWGWIISAVDSLGLLALLIEKRPVFEIYLAKKHLTVDESEVLQ